MSQNSVKRERAMIMDGSPCDTNFHADGPRSIAEAKKQGKSPCPHLEECDAGGLNTNTGYGCLLMYGRDVASFVVERGNTVHDEVHGEFKKFFMSSCNPPHGFVWSPDRKTFVLIADKNNALKKVEEFAEQVVG